MAPNENERQYRVIDQMISMHASLGQRYCRRALWLNSTLLAASAILCSLTFAPDNILTTVGVAEKATKLIVGGMGALIFALSIVELRVNWHHIGERHGEAATRLANLKAKYRACHELPADAKPPVQKELSQEYAKVMEALPPIPDRWFTKLKAEHWFKRVLSKEIDHHPTAPVWLLRCKLRWRGISEAFKKQQTTDRNE